MFREIECFHVQEDMYRIEEEDIGGDVRGVQIGCGRCGQIRRFRMVKVPVSNLYLMADEVQLGEVYAGKIMTEGEVTSEKDSKFNREEYTTKIMTSNGERLVRMNNTSRLMLVSRYGVDDKEWIGKEVVYICLEQEVFKKKRKVFYFAPDIKEIERFREERG